MPIRVMLDVSAVPERPVGAGVYTLHLARGLAIHPGIELHLLARRADERWPDIAPGATAVHRAVPDRRSARLVWEQTRAGGLARTVGPIDLWHGPHYTTPRAVGVPVVVTVHDCTFFDHPEWHERSKVAFFRRAITTAARRASLTIAVSGFTAGRLAELAPPRNPVRVIHEGVDHDRFHPATDAPTTGREVEALAAHGIVAPYLAFAGTAEPRKNLPNLVRAFGLIAHRHPGLRLVLAGGAGWGDGAVREAIAGSGAATRVVRPGYLPDAVVPALFRHAAAAVYPSFEEGFGLPALEALACGAPLVTSTGSAIAEVVGDAALCVDPHNHFALAGAIERALQADTANRLRVVGPARAQAFTWDRCVEEHVAAYTEAVGAPGSSPSPVGSPEETDRTVR